MLSPRALHSSELHRTTRNVKVTDGFCDIDPDFIAYYGLLRKPSESFHSVTLPRQLQFIHFFEWLTLVSKITLHEIMPI
jgi:hypothetical protein